MEFLNLSLEPLITLDNVVRRSFGARAGASRGGPVRSANAQRALAALQRSRNDADLIGNNSAVRFRTYYNSPAAFLAGGEFSAVVVLRESLELTGTTSYTRGQNLELDEPMYLIPPLTGWTSLRAMRNKWWGDLEARMAMPQNRVARIFADEDGTDGYYVINVRGGTTLGPGIDLIVGIDNLFDVHYHEHLSFGNLPNPGRNSYLTPSYSI